MTRTTLATAIGSAVLGGLAVGYLTVGPMATSAPSSGVSTLVTDTTVATDPDAPQPDSSTADDTTRDQRFREHVRTALAPLVADGSLTDAEVERIIDALIAARPERPEGPGPRVRAGIFLGEAAQVVADTIGITTEQLRTELKDQGTIAAVATAHGVDPQAVIDALVAKATATVDAKVASGDVSAERAAEIKANLVERTTHFVNETPKRRGPHPHPGDDVPADVPADGGDGG